MGSTKGHTGHTRLGHTRDAKVDRIRRVTICRLTVHIIHTAVRMEKAFASALNTHNEDYFLTVFRFSAPPIWEWKTVLTYFWKIT